MANVARVRVEIKKKYNDPHKNFKDMFQEFKRRVSNAGILADYKDHQYYETKSQKKRRKKMAAAKKFQMEALADKIMNGERVKAPSGLIKKVLNSHKKENKKDRDRDSQSQERFS
jgi:ribosomal protein S21